MRDALRVLIVKLSSLGDVVHTLPVLSDLTQALPGVQIDWVVERAFAPLLARSANLQRVVACDLRAWRRAPLAADTRAQWRAFGRELRGCAYDAVIDLQGLAKSALVARMARLAPAGRRYAMANRSDGSSYEIFTRWVADVAVPVAPRSHAVERARAVCAQALGYALPQPLRFGLETTTAAAQRSVVLVHGSSREDKCWPEAHWLALARGLAAQGWGIALPHGNASEQARSERLALALGAPAEVWPRLALDALTARMARCAGVIGVDSGLSHIAVALGLPHVQIYNFDTAWRTGPLHNAAHQRSVFAQPTPSVAAVASAWTSVTP